MLDALKLEWFDTWLKDEPTGLAGTSNPLHIFENNASQWVDTAAWPPAPATQTYYLGGTSLTASRPAGPGSDSLTWAAASTATALTYTSAPLTRSVVLDGPSDVTVYATSTAPETEITAILNIIAPDGTARAAGPDHPVRHRAPGELHRDTGRLPDPPPQELANLAGGVYTIERSSRAASFIDLPLTSPGQFTASPVDWGPSS